MSILAPRRWLLLVFSAALLAGAYGYYARIAEDYLQETIAEVDRTDPGWRLEELEAARPVVSEEKNSALCVLAAKRLLPTAPPNLGQELQNLLPPFQLNQDQFAELSSRMAGTRSALIEARRLVDLPDGRYPVAWEGPAALLAGTSHADEARTIANLLWLDALRLAQEGQSDEALASCRAALNAGRSLGDEPLTITQLIRLGNLAGALQAAERVLAQGEPSEASLAAWQQLLQVEEARPALLILLRADRAFWHSMMTAFESGDPRAIALEGELGHGKPEKVPPGAGALRLLAIPHVKQVHADVLRYLTGYVEAARLPADRQDAAFTEWDTTAELPLLLDHHVIRPMQMIASFRRTGAFLRCAIVAAALERFRRDRGRWPDALAELCPTCLAAVPADPFGGSLRYRRLADGVVVYSVGPDGTDDGGKLDRMNRKTRGATGSDIGFQLWEVAHRRMPPVIIFGPPQPGSR